MTDRQAVLDMDHCLLAIPNLAKFHASSVALFERDPRPDKQNTIPNCLTYDSHPRFEFFNEQGVKQFKNKIPKKNVKLANSFYEKGCDIMACHDNEFNVLNRGDFWVNNMLFKYDETNSPVEHVFIFSYVCLYTSAGIDLNYFTTSLADKAMMLNKETLINEYTRTLSSTMKKLNCKTSPPSFEQVKDMVRDRALYGIIVSIAILPLLLVGKEEATDLNEMLGEGVNPAYKGKIYKKAMISRLTRFHRMGVLD